MKFIIATVFCLFVSSAFAYPTAEDTFELDSAIAEAQEEQVRVQRNAGYGSSHGGYGGHAPVLHQQTLGYPVHPPKVQCGQSVLLGCAPTVAKVPCIPHHGGYGQSHGGYGGHGGYRSAFEAEPMPVPQTGAGSGAGQQQSQAQKW